MLFRRIGFTLVEMIIVISVIGILVASIYPQVIVYLVRGRDTERIGGIKQLSIAVTAYQVKNQILPVWTGTSNKCINQSILSAFYFQKFPIDPINTSLHWDCNLSWMFGYGTGKILAENKAVISAYLENPNGGNTWSINEYQGDAKSNSTMSEINFLKKWSGSGYVIHN